MSKKLSGSFELVLNGGLGNQLFGYAAGKSIEKETGLSCKFIRPASGDRSYELHNFGIEAESMSPLRSHPLNRKLTNRFMNRVRPNVFRFCESSFRFDARFYHHPSGETLYGYFQSYRYLENIKDQLLKLADSHVPFSKEFKSLEEKWAKENFIAVHVRRGDYIGKESYHGLASREYFRIAADTVLGINPKAKFIVFSDSIDLAQKDFPDAVAYISSKNLPKSSENLILMTRMGGIIGSNSSLSWWVGFLNKRTKINQFPYPWFANSSLDTSDLIPPEWNTIESGISSSQ